MPLPGPCCVYVHRRLSDGRIFYVGKGAGNRPHSRANRSSWWKSVAAKSGVIVEIVQDGLLEEDAHTLEIWLIAKFRMAGEKLVNMTDGGEGRLGHVSGLRKKVYCSSGDVFASTIKAAEWLRSQGFGKAHAKSITAACLGRKSMVYGHRWSYAGFPPKTKHRPVLWNVRPVFCSNGMRFDTASDAGVWVGKGSAAGSRISECCNGKRKSAFGFTWAFSAESIPEYRDPREGTEAAKRKPILCSNGMQFESRKDAVSWGRENGLRLSGARLIVCIKNPAARSGGLYWKEKEREDDSGYARSY